MRVDVEWLTPIRAALVALLAAAVVACGSDEQSGSTAQRTAPATARPPDARASGVVCAGPSCPVLTREEPCLPQPVDAEISAQDGEGAIVASTRTDADGDNSLSLEPGDYTLVADTRGALPFCKPVTVSVPKALVCPPAHSGRVGGDIHVFMDGALWVPGWLTVRRPSPGHLGVACGRGLPAD